MRRGLYGIVTAFTLSASALAQQGAPAAVPVGTVNAGRKPITQSLDFVGRIEAIERVEIKARVNGYLEDVLFQEGNVVREGTPLYRIEQGLFQAAVEQAQGALERSKSAKTLSEIKLQRAEELVARQAG